MLLRVLMLLLLLLVLLHVLLLGGLERRCSWSGRAMLGPLLRPRLRWTELPTLSWGC